MAHLGADVAAYVDGQLSDSTTHEASEHLESCDDCRKAVLQQRLLKSRMSTVATPELPAGLLASLAGLASTPPERPGWWVRLCRSLPLRAGLVVAGASLAVAAAAYAVGGPDKVGDDVSPPFDTYASDFIGGSTVQASNVISDTTIAALDGAGWPCHAILAGDLHRSSASYLDHEEIVALSYTDGSSRLNLFEQNGALDHTALSGFRPTVMGGSQVWIRPGLPTLVTWDEDGTVYTIVTDADMPRIAHAVADLPRSHGIEGVGQRVSDGLTRMTGWVGAA